MSGKKADRPTMRDVASAAGHSLSTVHRLLNGRGSVRADTAERIRTAAEGLGFHATEVIRQRIRAVRPRRTFGFLLQRPDAAFYQGLEAALLAAVEACAEVHGTAVVEYLKSQAPDRVAEHMVRLGAKVNALAVVVADHALVSEAVATVAARGVPVFALISDLGAPQLAGYAGLDNRRTGHSAAWFIAGLARRPGKVVMFVGSPRFQCQELGEIAFRSWFREHAREFELLETITTLESDEYGEERTRELLLRHPDLRGFYVGGGGVEGVLRALRAHRGAERPIGVGNDLTPVTRSALLAGHLHAVLSHPLPAMCRELVDQMAESLRKPGGGRRQAVVPLEIAVPSSV